MRIRYADLDDLPAVSEMCIMGLKELSAATPCAVSEGKLLDSIINHWAHAPCILLEDDEGLAGFYGLTTYVPYYSNDAVIGDYMLYIKPEKRSYKAAKMLSIAARDVADKFGLPLDLNFMLSQSSDIKTRGRFLENMGAKITGIKAVYHGR